VTGYDLVERVDEHRRVQRSEHASQRPGQSHLGEERDASSSVAGNRRPLPEDEPPAFIPRFLGHGHKQTAGLIIVERKQSQLFATVEPGGDTRRPPAELSSSGIEQNRPREASVPRVVNMHASSQR
jgi:hypothetical protein